MLKSIKDYVFVQMEGDLFNTDTGIKGHSGQSIVLDPSYEPQHHIKIKGKVVAVPDKLGRSPIAQETRGLPSYSFDHQFKYKRREDISPDVKMNDIIYFHFNSLLSDNKNLIDKKNQIYKIAYENILCAIRDFTGDGKELREIIMIGGYTMIEPDFETWEQTLIPIPQKLNGKVVVDKHGNPIMKPRDQWLIAKLKPELKYLSGFVVNVGKPLKGDSNNLKPGDKIIYTKNADWKIHIEGADYFIIKQRHILAHEIN